MCPEPSMASIQRLPQTQLTTEHILLVEDDDDSRDSLEELLVLRGYSVQTAITGEEAIRLAIANPPGVAIVDIGLPGITGFEVASRLSRFANPPLLIALSGWSRNSDRERGMRSG